MSLYKGLATDVQLIQCFGYLQYHINGTKMMQGRISVFLPSLPLYLTFKSRDRSLCSGLCPLCFAHWCHSAQGLHGPAPSPAPGRRCCLQTPLPDLLDAFDGTQALSSGSSWKVGRTDIEDGFSQTLAKKKQTSK